jgi:hypothetical protein
MTEMFMGYKPDKDEINPDNLKIRIPPKLAFKLFKYYTLGLMEKSESHQETQSGAAAATASVSDPIVKDLVEMDQITASGSPDLKRLMELEARLSQRDQEDMDKIRCQIPNSMATKLAIDELQSNFPKLERSVIETIYGMNGQSYQKSMERLTTNYPDKRRESSSSTSTSRNGYHETVGVMVRNIGIS